MTESRTLKQSSIFLALLSALFCGAAHAEISIGLGKGTVWENEVFTFEVFEEPATETAPDTTALEEDFFVVDKKEVRQYFAEGGAIVGFRSLTYQLKPKRAGDLSVAPVTIGPNQSRPIAITVKPFTCQSIPEIEERERDTGTRALGVGAYSDHFVTKVTAYVEPEEIYQGEAFKLVIAVEPANATFVPDGQSLNKDFCVATIGGIGHAKVVNGRNLRRAYTQVYELAARKSGAVVIPPIKVGFVESEPVRITVLTRDK